MGCVSSKEASPGEGDDEQQNHPQHEASVDNVADTVICHESAMVVQTSDPNSSTSVDADIESSYSDVASTSTGSTRQQWHTIDFVLKELTSGVRQPRRQGKGRNKRTISVTRERLTPSPTQSSQEDTSHNGRKMELQVLSNNEKLPEKISRKIRPMVSRDHQALEGLLDSERVRGCDHAHTLVTGETQGDNLEKKRSAEIGKENEVNKGLRDFKVKRGARISERRMSIQPNVSLHIIPELQDEPSDSESYQYLDTNIYF